MGAVLIVDDDPVNLRLLKAVLVQQGHDVTSATSVAEALEHYAYPGKFYAVISDYMMPNMTGADLARIMRKVDPAVKFVIVSAYDKNDIRAELGETWVDALISKPYSLATIRSVLADISLKPAL